MTPLPFLDPAALVRVSSDYTALNLLIAVVGLATIGGARRTTRIEAAAALRQE